MDKKLNKYQKIINNIIYYAMIFSIVYIFGLGIGLELIIPLQILFILLISTIVKFFILNPLFLYIILVTVFFSGIIINHFFIPFIPAFLDRTYFLFANIIKHIAGKEDIVPENMLIFWGILIVLVSLFTGFVIFKRKNICLLLPVYIGTFLYYWYVYYNQAYWMIALFFFLFFILMGLDKYSFKKLNTLWLKTITIYSFLIVSLAILIPKTNKYIQWPWLHNKLCDVFPGFEDLRSTNINSREYSKASLFDFSMTGYQEGNSKLGGPVKLDKKKVMTVRADSPTYLRGNIKHTYTGNSWKSITNSLENYRTGQDFSKLQDREKNTYYNEKSIIITNNSFASTTLFSPYKAAAIYFDDNCGIKVSPDGELVFPQGVYSGESYRINVLDPLPYKKAIDFGANQKKENIDNISIYLQLPKNKITNSTKTLVKEIVINAETDFEKALAIENHLRNNYKYNTDVEKVPSNREFIDYFLFESQEGYCTYFATTMAIMLRLEGIPSRYVEGYLANDLVNEGVYLVRNNNAHAWVEAFIEPVGWMTFEPTPSYPQIYRSEKHKSKKPVLNSENTKPLNIDDKNIREDIIKPPIEMNQELENDETDLVKDKNTPIIFIGIILLIISMKFIIRFVQVKHLDAKIKKLPNKKRIIYLYNEILKLTKLLGYSQEYGETHYEYADRISHNFYYFTDKGIIEITDIFVKNKYSNSPTSDEDVSEMEEYKKTIEIRLKNRLGLKTYYYNKYFK